MVGIVKRGLRGSNSLYYWLLVSDAELTWPHPIPVM